MIGPCVNCLCGHDASAHIDGLGPCLARSCRCGEFTQPAATELAKADNSLGTGKQELLSLAEWIERRYRLSEVPKIRTASEAEQIHAEIVRRLGEAQR